MNNHLGSVLFIPCVHDVAQKDILFVTVPSWEWLL